MRASNQLRDRWESAGQTRVFRFWASLDEAGRGRLLASLSDIDPDILALSAAPVPAPGRLEPPEALGPESLELPALAELGSDLLDAGRVAVVTVAGGQGTRLGFDGPKGAFPIGPVSSRSLFAVFAQQIARLGARHGRPLPWVLMTSPATDTATRAFFAEKESFGLDPGQIRFACQGTLPVLDLEGQALLAAPDRLLTAPDGHGGLFACLARSGVLSDLAGAGVENLFYHHVDNPLVRVADPAFLGLHRARGAEMSCKAVSKHDPAEKMGFLAQRGGRVEVIEYSEIEPEVVAARTPNGDLRFRLGSIGIHVLTRDFVEAVARGPSLPLHVARKTARALGPTGQIETVQARKLERFVFDALARARVVAVMETRREDEYSPVKNARGDASPETARRDLSALYRRWAVEAGFEALGEDVEIEMDHAQFDSPEDLRRSSHRRVSDAAPHVRIANGAER